MSHALVGIAVVALCGIPTHPGAGAPRDGQLVWRGLGGKLRGSTGWRKGGGGRVLTKRKEANTEHFTREVAEWTRFLRICKFHDAQEGDGADQFIGSD